MGGQALGFGVQGGLGSVSRPRTSYEVPFQVIYDHNTLP